MYEKFKENISKYGLLDGADTVLIGLSGGYDSMALAILFLRLREEIPIKLVALHVNHSIRKEAQADEDFVRDFALKNHMEFKSKKVDMAGFARKHSLSEEDAGRRLRYDFFNSVKKDYPNSVLATGHNLPDQVESFMLNLIRGSGLRGLLAMDFKNKDHIRPLLNFSREEIEELVENAGTGHRTDHTNFEDIYRRNSIRLKLIPFIKENYNPAFEDQVFRTTELLKEDYRIIESYIKDIRQEICREEGTRVRIKKEDFLRLDEPVKTRLLRSIIIDLKGSFSGFDRAHIMEFIKTAEAGPGKEMIINGLRLYSDYEEISLSLAKKENKLDINELKMGIKNNRFEFNNYLISFEVLDKLPEDKPGKNTAYIACQGLDEIYIRTRRPGDRIYPTGMRGSKKIKDIFIDSKVPREKRDTIPIFTDKNDILWVGGIRRSKKRLAQKNEGQILKIRLEEKDETN